MFGFKKRDNQENNDRRQKKTEKRENKKRTKDNKKGKSWSLFGKNNQKNKNDTFYGEDLGLENGFPVDSAVFDHETGKFIEQNEQSVNGEPIDDIDIDNFHEHQFEEIEFVDDLAFSQEEFINRNMIADALYTNHDLKQFNLTDNDVIKFFKNGSIYYKLKDPFDPEINKKIFKSDTKFSLNNDFKNLTNDLFFDDIKHDKAFDLDEMMTFDDGISEDLKHEVYKLNQKLQNNLTTIEEYKVSEDELDKIVRTQREIIANQQELKEKLVNLKDDYANSNVFYRIKNLEFNTWNEDDIYFGYKLKDFTFDVFSTDRIVVISDDSITNQLLIDVLRGDEPKTKGYIYKNLNREQKWIDVDNDDYNQFKVQGMDLNEEVFYGLTSPDYLSFGVNKKDNVGTTMNKIFKTLSVQVDEQFKTKLIDLLKFKRYLKVNIFELDDLNLEKFITLCDILIGKKIVLIKSICQGMSYNEKQELFKFLNKYFDRKKITVLYASDDYLEANLLATKIMVIKDSNLIEFKRVDNILKYFNSIDEFILHSLKHGHAKKGEE